MIQLSEHGVYLLHGKTVIDETDHQQLTGRLGSVPSKDEAKKGTMAYSILKTHNTVDDMEQLSLKFDSMTSHDITYVGIIQTPGPSGMKEFPLPYVLTNCHNSLCAVGGTINEDDHVFGLSAAKKYGGEFVPAHQSVIHSYMRERYAAPRQDDPGLRLPHPLRRLRHHGHRRGRSGAGPAAFIKKLYNIPYPKVIAIYLTGTPIPGVGPQDVALELIRSTFKDGVVKNCGRWNFSAPA